MCIAIPGQVITIDRSATPITAQVNFNGIQTEVVIQWVDNVEVNDYVIVHAGFAISKLDQAAALATLQLFEQQ